LARVLRHSGAYCCSKLFMALHIDPLATNEGGMPTKEYSKGSKLSVTQLCKVHRNVIT